MQNGMVSGGAPHGMPVGDLLARARKGKRLSQLALALESGISARHLSFLETGRARPSREMVLRLCDALGVAARDADAFLLAAGFAPMHRETPLEAPAMAEVLAALRLLLERHEPYPAIAFDGAWDVVMCNGAYAGAVDACLAAGADPAAGSGPVAPLALLPAPRPNLLRLLCHPNGARRLLANWGAVTKALLERVMRESRQPGADPAVRPPLEEALAYPGVARLLKDGASGPAALLIPTEFRQPDGGVARFVSTIATLGTAQDLTLRELRIETYHPV